MQPAAFSKIIWPVDVLDTPDLQKGALFILGALTRATGAEIKPVYVLSPPYAGSAALPLADFEQAFRTLAEKRLAELPSYCGIATMRPGAILTNRSGSIRKDVQCLLNYASAEAADAVVVSTHGRVGLSRFFIGSFAETLAVHSTIPVIAVNPAAKVRESLSKILFPTDFQPRFRPGFERAVELAKSVGAEITLFYKEPVVPAQFMTPELYAYLSQTMEERRSQAKEWQGWAAGRGVKVETHIDGQAGYLVPSIEDFASQGNFDLVAMASQADSASALLMGSAARQMIRHSPCPVWILKVENKN